MKDSYLKQLRKMLLPQGRWTTVDKFYKKTGSHNLRSRVAESNKDYYDGKFPHLIVSERMKDRNSHKYFFK